MTGSAPLFGVHVACTTCSARFHATCAKRSAQQARHLPQSPSGLPMSCPMCMHLTLPMPRVRRDEALRRRTSRGRSFPRSQISSSSPCDLPMTSLHVCMQAHKPYTCASCAPLLKRGVDSATAGGRAGKKSRTGAKASKMADYQKQALAALV